MRCCGVKYQEFQSTGPRKEQKMKKSKKAFKIHKTHVRCIKTSLVKRSRALFRILLRITTTTTTMSKAFNTNFIKCVFVAVLFGFLFQLREIAAEYQCPSFGALVFFCRPRLMCQQRSRDVPHQPRRTDLIGSR